MIYLKTKYGSECYKKILTAANDFQPKEGYSDCLSREDSAAAVKKAYGDNVFKDFAKWYKANESMFDEPI